MKKQDFVDNSQETRSDENCAFPPQRKKQRLSSSFDENNMETNNNENNNNENNNNENNNNENNNNDQHGNDLDVAFWLNHSSWISTEYNEYSLTLNDIICLNNDDDKKNDDNVIEKCIIFNYKVNLEWLFGICPILVNSEKIQKLIICHGDNPKEHHTMCQYLDIYHHLQIFKVKIPYAYGTHHSKMIMLTYKNKGIRVVVCTANMIQKDWCYKTNATYLQDFPLKIEKTTPKTSQFEETLYDYCTQIQGVNVDFRFLKSYDFSSAKVLLIPSVPGYHKDNKLNKYGYLRVQECLKKYFVIDDHTKTTLSPLIAQFSSIGSISESWLIDEFTASLLDFQERTDNNVVTNNTINNNKSLAYSQNTLKIIWPTVEDVRQSIEGYNAGGSLCSSFKNFKPFFNKYCCKWNAINSGRQHLMPHIKSYSRFMNNYNKLAWLLITSHNCSQAAWGKLLHNKKTLFIRSYEMGVLYIPQYYNQNIYFQQYHHFHLTNLSKHVVANYKNYHLHAISKNESKSFDKNCQFEFTMVHQKLKNVDENNDQNVVKCLFPIPMNVINCEPYNNNDKPWIWDLKYSTPDVHNETWNV